MSASLATLIDHSLLAPEATEADVVAALRTAERVRCAALCISPIWVATAHSERIDREVRIATVIGFPSGAHTRTTKAFEAAEAVASGADEIDVVVDLGHLVAGNRGAVALELELVRAMTLDRTLKVILETALLDSAQIRDACRVAVDCGADFVKTSTGFHPQGGATVEAVRTMREAVGDGVGVKASGGIRTKDAALSMVEAGASRIGTSSTEAILA